MGGLKTLGRKQKCGSVFPVCRISKIQRLHSLRSEPPSQLGYTGCRLFLAERLYAVSCPEPYALDIFSAFCRRHGEAVNVKPGPRRANLGKRRKIITPALYEDVEKTFGLLTEAVVNLSCEGRSEHVSPVRWGAIIPPSDRQP